MPASPDGEEREDGRIASAQFLMQAVNRSNIWVYSLKCAAHFLKVMKTGFANDFRRKCLDFQYFMAGRDTLANILLLLLLLLFLQDEVKF